eukprot:1579008-Rhodomonas_salina.2
MVLSISTTYLGPKKPFPMAQLRQRIQDQLCSEGKLQVTLVMVKALPSGTRAAKAAFEVQLILDDNAFLWLEGHTVVMFGEGQDRTRLFGVLQDDGLTLLRI